jgi:DHA1 family inner membrane transport protein
LTLLYFTAIFTIFAYVGPVLQALGPLSVPTVSFTLLAVGVSGVVGTLVGGYGTDRLGPVASLRVQLVVFVVTQALLPFTAGHYPLMLATLWVWGVAGFGMMPAQQTRLAAAAPASAPLLLSLNTSMLYLGTALGAVVGGAASQSLGFGRVAWAGVPFLALGLLTLVRKR